MQMFVLFLTVGGAFWYWRRNQKVDLFESDYEKSETGRHRVDMASRIDQEKLQKWLAAEERKEQELQQQQARDKQAVASGSAKAQLQ